MRTRRTLEGKRTDEERREAMNRVIDQCIADGILEKLLTERRDEIMETSIFQYDQEAHEWALHEDGYDEGIRQQRLEDAETISRYQDQIAAMQTEMAAVQMEKAAMQAELESLRARVDA